MPVLDRVERRHEQPLEPLERIRLAVDDFLVAAEQPVQEAVQQLVDHLFLGREVVVEAARQNAGTVSDVAHRGRAQATFGEHRRRQFQKLVAPVHGC